MKAILVSIALRVSLGPLMPNPVQPRFRVRMEGWKSSEQTPITTIVSEAAHTGEMGLRGMINPTQMVRDFLTMPSR